MWVGERAADFSVHPLFEEFEFFFSMYHMFQEYYWNRGTGQIPKEKEQLSNFGWLSRWVFLSFQHPGPRDSVWPLMIISQGTARRAGAQLPPRPAEREPAFWKDAQMCRVDAQGDEALVFRLQPPPELQVQKTSVFQFCDSAQQRMNGKVAPSLWVQAGEGREQEGFRTLLSPHKRLSHVRSEACGFQQLPT